MSAKTKTDAKPAENELVIERTFDAPRELVWRAWTDPAHFVRWWAPKIFTTPHCTIDLRVGGELHYCMRSSEGEEAWKKGIWGKGVFKEIVPPSRLVLDWYFSNEKGDIVSPAEFGMPEIPRDMLLTVTFEDRDGKTFMRMRQSLPLPLARKLGAHEGWGQSFDKLDALLATL